MQPIGTCFELFEFFIHLREFAIKDCNWDNLPDNVMDLRSLKRLTITSCLYLKSLPELPQSLEKLKVSNCNKEFMTSCEQIDHPNWQKIQHIEVKEFLVEYDYRSMEVYIYAHLYFLWLLLSQL